LGTIVVVIPTAHKWEAFHRSLSDRRTLEGDRFLVKTKSAVHYIDLMSALFLEISFKISE
jgi:hypothetical protein